MAKIKRVRTKQPKSFDKLFARIKRKTSPILTEHKNLRNKVTRTWSATDKPTFVPSISLEGTKVVWTVKVDAPVAEGASKSVWRLLNDGTEVRRAQMTNPFVRKTTVGEFTSKKGVGGMLYFNKDLEYPGIDAGKWDEKANETLHPKLLEAVKVAIREFNRN